MFHYSDCRDADLDVLRLQTVGPVQLPGLKGAQLARRSKCPVIVCLVTHYASQSVCLITLNGS